MRTSIITVAIVGAGLFAMHAGCPGSGVSGSAVGPRVDRPELAPPLDRRRCDLDRHPGVFPIRPEGNQGGGCRPSTCGENASYLTGSMLDALNLDGCANIDGVRLVPASLRIDDGDCRDQPTKLDVHGGLIWGAGRVGLASSCQGPVRVGATFWVEGPARSFRFDGAAVPRAPRLGEDPVDPLVRVELQVRRVDSVTGEVGELPTYVIGPTGAGATWAGQSWAETPRPATPPAVNMCQFASAFLPPWEATLRGVEPPRDCQRSEGDDPRHDTIDPQDPTRWECNTRAIKGLNASLARSDNQQAIIAAGEVYYLNGSIRPTEEPAKWFHLACAGGVLAKARLAGYGPAAPAEDLRTKRVAFHKMSMAFYCDHADTETGTPVFMYRSPEDARSQLEEMPPEAKEFRGPLEAYWNEEGATCIDHSRLWMKGRTVPAWVRRRLDIWLKRDGTRPAPRMTSAEEEQAFVEMVRAHCGGLPTCVRMSTHGLALPRTQGTDEVGNGTVDHLDHDTGRESGGVGLPGSP